MLYINTEIVEAKEVSLGIAEELFYPHRLDLSLCGDETTCYVVFEGNTPLRFIPKSMFESKFKPMPKNKLTFSEALTALKAGYKIARKGWNGKGMYLWLKPVATIKSEWCKDPVLKNIADENGGSVEALGTICMYTKDSTGRKAILTGWLASQSDLLLNDWMILS